MHPSSERWLGIVGGTSWESTALYYRILNETVRTQQGGLHSARLLLASVDFAPLEADMRTGNWPAVEACLLQAGKRLVAAGAGALLLASNTLHRLYPILSTALPVPMLHIADAAGAALSRDGHRRVLLLGTQYTMEAPFYRERLAEAWGLTALIPSPAERQALQRLIFDDLCQGRVPPEGTRLLQALTGQEGIDAVLLGCTELTLALPGHAAACPVYDTARLHAEAGASWLLEDCA